MNSYGNRHARRKMKEAIADETARFIEHCDLIMLWSMHEVLGLGATRLRRCYKTFCKAYDDFRDRYRREDDVRTLGERGDTLVLKARLKEIGFDYDAEIDAIQKEMEEEANG